MGLCLDRPLQGPAAHEVPVDTDAMPARRGRSVGQSIGAVRDRHAPMCLPRFHAIPTATDLPPGTIGPAERGPRPGGLGLDGQGSEDRRSIDQML